VPFLRHEYLRTWWQTRGGGEWPEARLHTLLQRDMKGKLVGAAPLFAARNRDGLNALLLVGSIEISDYLDLLAAEADMPALVEALFDHLASGEAPEWQALDLYNLPDDSPTLAVLQEAARRRGWSYTQEQLQSCPYIPLPGDWDAYLAGIDKKQRHEIRRKMRRAEEAQPPVRWYFVEDGDRLEAEMENFMALMAMDPEKERFLTPEMRTQMQLSARAAFDAGWLQLAFLEAGGQKAAGYLNFDYADHIWVYNSGLNFDMRELSPGWVLLGHLLKWANENQRRAFDFMRGDEDYKYRFGGINRYVVRAVIRK
jgi:CelD/BcsL family acetyltransferase involved in cellulose biosynthesis